MDLIPLRTPLTYSPSVTIPLTHDCPWNCAYCGYRSDRQGLIREEEIERLLALGAKWGVTEVLLMAGENADTLPHLRKELVERGHERFIDFAVAVSARALERGFLPHTNIGALGERQLRALKEVNASQGLMLENIDEAFNARVAPQKRAAGRLRTIAAAGRARIPYTSGILIGLGETHASRRESLAALAELHARHGHLQEIIIQNYVPNAGSRWPAQSVAREEYLDLIAHWRELAPDVAIQVPPNLNPHWRDLLPYIDDLGGISAEGDLINPQNPWSAVEVYAEAARAAGRELVSRLAVYEKFAREPWLSRRVRSRIDRIAKAARPLRATTSIWDWSTDDLSAAAAELNRRLNGDRVTYVVNRNANFTNICNVGCAFCGFQRRAADADAYTRTAEEIIARLAETPEITEVCLQGGIHPGLDFAYYIRLVQTLKAWRPDLHIHAFSPMEIHSLKEKTGWSYERVLAELRDAGLGTIPGTAAEILDDEVRREISSRKLGAAEWIEIVKTAHRLGLRSTATIMFGHVESWGHIRAHFERLREIQEATGGFTEFVPLQFVPYENRLGHRIRPEAAEVREKARRLYPLARLFFGESIRHLQTSWVKLGVAEAAEFLGRGCDDFGGTLFEESITRASGGTHGECLLPAQIEKAIRGAGKIPAQRRTIY
jgi:FO synthase